MSGWHRKAPAALLPAAAQPCAQTASATTGRGRSCRERRRRRQPRSDGRSVALAHPVQVAQVIGVQRLDLLLNLQAARQRYITESGLPAQRL